MRLPWTAIDTVLLDMDGTILDLHFDNRFWLEHLPRRYAEVRGLAPEAARAELLARYRAVEGTLAWYCVEHWNRELGLDVVALKRELEHLIGFLPGAVGFLDALRAAGKRVVLATNAHPHSLALKVEKTGLDGHFDALVSSHALRAPKESAAFWQRLEAALGYDPARTLFADDSPRVLEAARAHGRIGHLVAVLHPDTREAAKAPSGAFTEVHALAELLPVCEG